MFRKFCNWYLYQFLGWKKNITVSHPDKYILCLAPHTSNWDFFLGQLYSHAEGVKINFLIKKEWFFWPLGSLFKAAGGIPVWRSRHSSMTDQLADIAIKSKHFRLCITPEGTRSYNPDWKKGFYFIALKAGIPVLLYGVDYKDKLISCTKIITPSGDFDKDIAEIKQYYSSFVGKYPQKFGY